MRVLNIKVNRSDGRSILLRVTVIPRAAAANLDIERPERAVRERTDAEDGLEIAAAGAFIGQLVLDTPETVIAYLRARTETAKDGTVLTARCYEPDDELLLQRLNAAVPPPDPVAVTLP